MRTGTARQEQVERLGRMLFGGRSMSRSDGRFRRGPQRPAAVMVLAPLLGVVLWVVLALVII